MKRFFTYILAALFSLYLLVSLAWGNAAARHRLYKGFDVTVVDSARAQYVTAAEVAAHLSKYIKADENTLLQDINTEDLEEQLYQNRLIEEVRCYKTPSGLLRVDISQRVPILRVLGDSAAYFLDEHGIAHTDRHIVEDNPTAEELAAWQEKSGLPVRRFFNTSGMKYRELGVKAQLDAGMTDVEAFDLLATDGMLVKRPIVVTDDTVLVGFREAAWEETLL